MNTSHGQEGHCKIHAVFKDNIPKRDDTGGGRKGNKKSDDAEGEQTQSPVGKKGQNQEREQEQE